MCLRGGLVLLAGGGDFSAQLRQPCAGVLFGLDRLRAVGPELSDNVFNVLIQRPFFDGKFLFGFEDGRAQIFRVGGGRIFQFDMPFPGLLTATFSSSAWQHWLAFDGATPVAAAITHVKGDIAWIGWVCTLPEYRGRGAQSALAAAQLQGIRQRGARWVTLEAATGTKRNPAPSLRNYLRLGWTHAYDRLIYLRRLPVPA